MKGIFVRVLIVRAHPLESNKSRSMTMADTFRDAFKETHPDARVEELRLYEVAIPEIDMDLLSGWEALAGGEHFAHLTQQQQAKLTLYDNYTDQFLNADLVVVANPLWNLSIPTRLKAWVDTICRSGVTFRYTDTGAAEGLVQGKKLVHLQASGGHFGGNDPAAQYIKQIGAFLGCEVSSVIAEGLDHEPHRADEIMNDTLERVRDLAKKI
ncbi:FMN-dependent NADH-azoreductase [Corynebacterium pilosum]|uniref:FMN dependent NADH:quinone oxidoreductase n=1 Tax=Corynebacterium pilosum TaxID=35756 RepID=A0A376CMY4_9CORY|nr:FMN-dependent NADH-azoreductase [Corynebacterium pilosum]